MRMKSVYNSTLVEWKSGEKGNDMLYRLLSIYLWMSVCLTSGALSKE